MVEQNSGTLNISTLSTSDLTLINEVKDNSFMYKSNCTRNNAEKHKIIGVYETIAEQINSKNSEENKLSGTIFCN